MKLIVAILILLCSSFVGDAQSVNNTAPIDWKEYAISEKGLSIVFPKFPIVYSESQYCTEYSITVYAAYADNRVYQMKVFKKESDTDLGNCRNIKKFDQTTFNETIEKVKNTRKFDSKTNENQNGREVVSLISFDSKIKFYNDLKNDKFIEMGVFSSAVKQDESIERKFFESLKFNAGSKGIDIGKGANAILGDQPEIEEPEKKTTSNDTAIIKKAETTPMRVIGKPRPPYTQMARKENTQGAVLLRVTFLANGSVGAVTVVEGLPNGLTEEAIAAVRKLAFLPQQNNGVNVSVSRIVQYSFSIF